MKDIPVDIDSGVNTLTLIKTATGWRYRRRTWDQLYAPTFDQPAIESLDALFATIGGNSWHEWLAAQESTQES